MGTPRRLNVEGLEKRAMLAGNVSVVVDGGDLIITGDGAANGVALRQIDTGRYAVTGFSIGAGNTTVNGGTNAVVVNGVTGDIEVDLNAGDDMFIMGQNTNRNQVLANQLSGNTAGTIGIGPAANPNTTAAFQTRVPVNLWIRTDEGADRVGISGARIGSDDIEGHDVGGIGQILTGDSADRVIAERVSAFDDFLLETGAGNDFVRAAQIRTWDFFFATLGDGNDTLRVSNYHGYHSHLIGNAGDDTITAVHFHTDLETFLFGEGGHDRIAADNLTAQDLQIISHEGADRVNLNNVRVRNYMYVDTGASNDIVTANALTVGGFLHIVLGSENDRLNIGNSFSNDTLLDGGSNFDTLNNNGNNDLRSNDVINFEQFLIAGA